MKSIVSYKKSILLSIGFLFFTAALTAQEPGRIMQLLANKELQRAKEAVDSAVQLTPSASNWLLKAVVYDSIANDPASKQLLADARWESFLALQNAAAADAGNTGESQGINKTGLAKDIYTGFTLQGMQYFNAGAERNDKASFALALAIFKKAATVNQFIYSDTKTKTAADTILLLHLAKSAIYAEKEEDAVSYCKKIVDDNWVTPQNKAGYEPVYQWLVYHFKSRKEAAAFSKYLAAAVAQFPASDYFMLAEIDWLRDQQQYPALFKKYRQLVQSVPGNAQYKLAYYRDQFNYIWQPGGTNSQNTLVSIKGLIAGLQQLISTNKQNLAGANARLLLAKLYSNQAQDVAYELLMRSTTDPKVTSAYKKWQHDLLLLSNQYLKQITAGNISKTETLSREAAQLLKQNSLLLKATVNR